MFLRSLYITASPVQLFTYLLGVCLFSISFLVFLNSSVSFVITDRIGQKRHVGDAVGTLGFADELLALVACPAWGVLSDKIGVRSVTVMGYTIVGVSLIGFVRARNVYPELLLGRLVFALGGAATSTMVTAILPCMTQVQDEPDNDLPTQPSNAQPSSPSESSDVTITPSQSVVLPEIPQTPPDPISISSRLAGFVGLFTGMGALIALVVFLPLPARLTSPEHPRSEALVSAYSIVGAMALFVASLCSFGLANLPGEKNKRIVNLLSVFRTPQTDEIFPPPTADRSSPYLLLQALRLAIRDRTVLLAYVAGFVARASSVAISLFIPLLVNASFVASGKCDDPGDKDSPGQWKDECRSAYVVASMLTGVSQLVALICAPAFGFVGTGRRRPSTSNPIADHSVPWALLVAAGAGVVGYVLVGSRKLDLNFDREDTHRQVVWSAFVVVMLLGFSQIGAIVCSLALLARAVQQQSTSNGLGDEGDSDDATTLAASSGDEGDEVQRDISPLLGRTRPRGRSHLKGSMAGVYSLAGGAGILILTKLGGWLFDRAGWGWPFYLMASFNAILLGVGLICTILTRRESRSQSH